MLCALKSDSQLCKNSDKIGNNYQKCFAFLFFPLFFFNRLWDTLQQIFHTGVCVTIIINARKLCEGLPVLSKLALAENGKMNGGRVEKKAAVKMT